MTTTQLAIMAPADYKASMDLYLPGYYPAFFERRLVEDDQQDQNSRMSSAREEMLHPQCYLKVSFPITSAYLLDIPWSMLLLRLLPLKLCRGVSSAYACSNRSGREVRKEQ